MKYSSESFRPSTQYIFKDPSRTVLIFATYIWVNFKIKIEMLFICK
jgi:hypothetical protein